MKIVAVGDVGIDIYLKQKLEKPGGIAFNFAYNARENGADVSLVSVVGRDRYQKKLKNLLKRTNINYSCVHALQGTSPIQKINLESSGERKFVGYDPGVLKKWKLTVDDLDFIAKQDAVFVPLSDGMKHIFEEIAYLKTKTLKIADFSQDSEYADFDKKNSSIEVYSPYFDIIFVGATGKQKKLLLKLSKKYPKKVFILTLGEKGSIGYQNGNISIQPAEKIEKIVDTTGAGDAFQASFLVSYLAIKDIAHALRHAAIKSSKITEHVGSTPISF